MDIEGDRALCSGTDSEYEAFKNSPNGSYGQKKVTFQLKKYHFRIRTFSENPDSVLYVVFVHVSEVYCQEFTQRFGWNNIFPRAKHK